MTLYNVIYFGVQGVSLSSLRGATQTIYRWFQVTVVVRMWTVGQETDRSHSAFVPMCHWRCSWCGVVKTHLKLYNGLATGLDRLLGCRPYHPFWWLCRNNSRLKTEVGSVPVQWTRTNTNCRMSDDSQPDGKRYINHRADRPPSLVVFLSLFCIRTPSEVSGEQISRVRFEASKSVNT